MEAELARERNKLELGYSSSTDGSFVKQSSVQLRNLMKTSDSENIRRACYEGLRSIGDAVVDKVGMMNIKTY